jgi:hypothetical protein
MHAEVGDSLDRSRTVERNAMTLRIEDYALISG